VPLLQKITPCSLAFEAAKRNLLLLFPFFPFFSPRFGLKVKHAFTFVHLTGNRESRLEQGEREELAIENEKRFNCF